MADKEKMREDASTKIWISREQNELFRWKKALFIAFEELLFGEK